MIRFLPIILGVFFLFIVVVQRCATSLIDEPVESNKVSSAVTIDPSPKQTPSVQKKISRAKLFRRIFLDPSRRFEQSTIFQDDQEIAWFKTDTVNGVVYDVEGAIPDGEVEFRYSATQDYGFENYKNGKRHGNYREYYKTGQAKKEAYYFYGRLMQRNEYFIDGQLRMEEDYSDALMVEGRSEVGEGKVYFRNGQLRYEWVFTTKHQGGYDKSYDQLGNLTAERTYDATGALVKKYFR